MTKLLNGNETLQSYSIWWARNINIFEEVFILIEETIK